MGDADWASKSELTAEQHDSLRTIADLIQQTLPFSSSVCVKFFLEMFNFLLCAVNKLFVMCLFLLFRAVPRRKRPHH